jgi:hypothetical protein
MFSIYDEGRYVELRLFDFGVVWGKIFEVDESAEALKLVNPHGEETRVNFDDVREALFMAKPEAWI